MDRAKPFCIAKRDVWEAYKRVKANQGAAGVDGESIADFEEDLGNNLYRIWNRMSSGSYFPPAVRRVDIPKGGGRTSRSEFRLSRTASPRRWCSDIWSQYWSLCSIRTPTGIAPGGRHMMHWTWRGRDAGAMTGCSTWTFEVSLMKSTGNFL